MLLEVILVLNHNRFYFIYEFHFLNIIEGASLIFRIPLLSQIRYECFKQNFIEQVAWGNIEDPPSHT